MFSEGPEVTDLQDNFSNEVACTYSALNHSLRTIVLNKSLTVISLIFDIVQPKVD